MRLIYGYDPLCGWCYGFVPALRAVEGAYPDLAIKLVTPGLVTGARVGPYALMEDYIRGASENLKRVTGRAPSAAFFALIRQDGVVGDSVPPLTALSHVMAEAPEQALPVAHALIEAHFEEGADLGRPAVYADIWHSLGLTLALPDLADRDRAKRAMAEADPFGIRSFPTLMLERGAERLVMPSLYDPEAVVAWVAGALGEEA